MPPGGARRSMGRRKQDNAKSGIVPCLRPELLEAAPPPSMPSGGRQRHAGISAVRAGREDGAPAACGQRKGRACRPRARVGERDRQADRQRQRQSHEAKGTKRRLLATALRQQAPRLRTIPARAMLALAKPARCQARAAARPPPAAPAPAPLRMPAAREHSAKQASAMPARASRRQKARAPGRSASAMPQCLRVSAKGRPSRRAGPERACGTGPAPRHAGRPGSPERDRTWAARLAASRTARASAPPAASPAPPAPASPRSLRARRRSAPPAPEAGLTAGRPGQARRRRRVRRPGRRRSAACRRRADPKRSRQSTWIRRCGRS